MTSRFRPDPDLFPFSSRFFESTVGSVHYVDEGEGAPILFLHGNPTWSFLYREIIARLRDAFRCVAVDYPGFGLSTHPDGYGFTPGEHSRIVGELVRHLDLEDVTVVGHDWGGPIGMRVALDEPDRIRALVMGNTWYWPIRALHIRAFSVVLSTGLLQRWILRGDSFVERLVPLATKREVPQEVMEHYRRPFSDPSSRRGVAELPRQLRWAEGWLTAIAAGVPDVLGDRPVLLPWGTRDIAFPISFAERFREDFRSTELLRLDARHFIQEDAPGRIAAGIRGFLDRGRGRGGTS